MNYVLSRLAQEDIEASWKVRWLILVSNKLKNMYLALSTI